MGALKVAAAALGLMIGTLAAAPAYAWNRGNVQVLTVLPDLLNQPGVKSSVEGLTVGPDGNIYVPTFGFNTQGATSGPANLFVISPNGKIVRQVTIANSSPHILGLRFNPVNNFLLVLDFGAGQVLHVDPQTGNSSVFMVAPTLPPIPGPGLPPGPGLNALTFDKSGNVYVSDSFQGVIWQTGPNGGTPTIFSQNVLLGPGNPFGSLTPPFGANGVEFSNDGKTLFVANTAFHQIIQIPVTAPTMTGGLPTAGTPSIFITGINAPDGIAIDSNDNIWICANQEDEIVVSDNKSILYVSNLTLFLPFAGAHLAIDSAWTLQVQGYTVSKLPAKIPPIAGD